MQSLVDRIAAQGQRVFGVAIVLIGGEHLVCARMSEQPFPARFHAIVIPVIPWIPAHPWLAYLTGVVFVVAGLCILANVRARGAALVFGAILLGCDLVMHIPHMLAAPENWALRGEVCEMLALSSAAFVLAGTLRRADGSAAPWDGALANFGRVLFGVTLVVFGIDHYLALQLIASLVPSWLPAHTFFAVFTGTALIAAGISIATRWMGVWGGLALGAMFLLWFLTLHLPLVSRTPTNPNQWSSAFIALGMCGASWICARALLLARPARDIT